MNGVSPSGMFICSKILGTEQTIARGISACPAGWEVFNYDDDYLCFTAEENGAAVGMEKSSDDAPEIDLRYITRSSCGWKNFIVGET